MCLFNKTKKKLLEQDLKIASLNSEIASLKSANESLAEQLSIANVELDKYAQATKAAYDKRVASAKKAAAARWNK